jgi:hypothetical protein
MRILESFVFDDIRVSIFSMNNKYIVKLEAGPYEQSYKIDTEDVEGLPAVRKMLNEDFLSTCRELFLTMHNNFQSAIEHPMD